MDLWSQHPSLAILLFARMAKRSSGCLAQNSLWKCLWDSLELAARAEGSAGPCNLLQIKGILKLAICMARLQELWLCRAHPASVGADPSWPRGELGGNKTIWGREGGSWEKGKAALGMGPREEQGMGTMREWQPGDPGLAEVCFGSSLTELAK